MIHRASMITPLLALVLLAGALGGCSRYDQPIKRVTVHTNTPAERKESIAELRDAWLARERLADNKGKKAEFRFLVRLATTVNRFKDTESYTDICRLWNECLKEHLSRFPDSEA